jgi:hypothetical protein
LMLWLDQILLSNLYDLPFKTQSSRRLGEINHSQMELRLL